MARRTRTSPSAIIVTPLDAPIWLHSPFLQKSSCNLRFSLANLRVVIYYRDMKNTTQSAKNQIVLDGVTIAWSDTRRMREDETGDLDMVGSFRVTLSMSGCGLSAIANALVCAQTLEKVANLGDLFCPYSDSFLRPIGLSPIGSVMLQIYRAERKCDAAPVQDLSHLDPTRYSKDEAAMKSIAWMRDVAQAIVTYHDALCLARDEHEAGDALHAEIFQIPQESQ